jgi:hypothetical protein
MQTFKHDQHTVWKDGIDIEVCNVDCRACAIFDLRGRMEALARGWVSTAPPNAHGIIINRLAGELRAAVDAPGPTQSEVSTLRGRMEAPRNLIKSLQQEWLIGKDAGNNLLAALDAPAETGKPTAPTGTFTQVDDRKFDAPAGKGDSNGQG